MFRSAQVPTTASALLSCQQYLIVVQASTACLQGELQKGLLQDGLLQAWLAHRQHCPSFATRVLTPAVHAQVDATARTISTDGAPTTYLTSTFKRCLRCALPLNLCRINSRSRLSRACSCLRSDRRRRTLTAVRNAALNDAEQG